MIKPRVLGQQLNKEIVGQDRALEAVVRSVVVADLGVADPQRPLASFLFIGPTGTGKSQLGRSLAKALHNDAGAVITVNCTEFKSPHDVAKLVGAPPGYVGHERPPFLTQEKLDPKSTVVVFEELEKADRALFDLLLQVLDRGELKTGRGVDLDFCNCFIIMTSNVCAKEVDALTQGGSIGFGPPGMRLDAMQPDLAHERIETICTGAVEDFFSPEFLNRIDEIVTFNPLKDEHLMAILEKFLMETRIRFAMVGIATSISENAKRFLIEQGTNLRYGARPLRRAVRRYLEFPVARLVAEEALDAGRIVHVEAGDARLHFHVKAPMLEACSG